MISFFTQNKIVGFKTRRSFKLMLFAFFLMKITSSSASHLAGGNVTYTNTTGNTYRIVFTLYRDCKGIAAPATLTVNLVSASCGYNITTTAQQVPGTGTDVNPPCPGTITACHGGTYPGIQKWQYFINYTLPVRCADWRFSFSLNARNAAITTLQMASTYNMYVEATLNNLTVTNNNSVDFTNDPILFVCTNQNYCFSPGALDSDGDSISYSFIQPRSDVSTFVPYVAGYNVNNPISSSPPVSISPTTGLVCMTPTALEVGVIVVRINEYRKVNGVPVLIGSTMRDMQVYTLNCNNSIPLLSGIDSTSSYTLSLCAGSSKCFKVYSNDADATQQLTDSFINTSGLTIAFDTTRGTLHPTANICVTTTPSQIGNTYNFSIAIKDNNCPTNGTNIANYSIVVTGLQANVTSTPVSCKGGNNGTASATATNSSGTIQYFWSPTQATTQTITGLSAGTYSVNIIDASGCSATQTVTVTEPPALSVSASNVVPVTCGSLGSFTINVSGGNPNYTYFTNSNPVQTTASVTNLSPATYTTTVRDSKGCRATIATWIQDFSSILALTETHTDVSCNGSNDGVINLAVSGGNGPYIYQWSNGGSQSSISNLPPSIYFVTVTDANGCGGYALISITEPALLTLTAGNNSVLCEGSTLMLTSSANGGTGTIQYTWSGPSGYSSTDQNPVIANTTAANSGTYTVAASDANGCQASAVVSALIYPMPVVTINPPTANIYQGDSIQLCGVGAIDYIWSPGGETTPCIYAKTAGTYTVTGYDGAGCSSSGTSTVTVTVVPPQSCTCDLFYPDSSNVPRSLVVFNENYILAASDPGPLECVVKGPLIKLWYTDEHALTLGVRRVNVKTSTGISTTDYAITPAPLTPGCVFSPLVGDTISSGDQAGNDVAAGGGRPLWPAIFITDLTVNGPNSRAGDWQQGGVGKPPIKVCGTWKGAVRTVDKTRNPPLVTVTPDINPPKNVWAGIPDTPPRGFASIRNEGYSAEVIWDVDSLGLIPGHTYRLQFMVHDGDQNKTGGDCGQSCTTVMYPVAPYNDSAHAKCGACKQTYPDNSNLPRSKVVFNESEVLRASDPGPDACGAVGSTIKVWYNDEHALTLGVRQVNVKTTTGISTTNYPITPTPLTPRCAPGVNVGDTISSGDQSGNDVAAGGGRPMWPALFITDITLDSTARSGDWQQGGIGIPAENVCGTWKAAVKLVDKTKNPPEVTVKPDADPAKNNWSGIPDIPPGGFAKYKNEGYGAECTWNVSSLNFLPGHTYRLQFMVHDGDQNKTGGDCGESCATIYMPKPRMESPNTIVSGGVMATAYPNPFSTSTTIAFQRDKAAHTVVEVYTLHGSRVAKLFDRDTESGVIYKTEFHTEDIPNGLYIYRVTSNNEVLTGKLVLMKQ